MKCRRIEIVAYDPDWVNQYQKEAEKLKAVLRPQLVAIHHIGSTAIPNIKAKPVIDILVQVREIARVDDFNDAMIQLGYEPKGENGIAGRRYFRKRHGEQHTHHVHIFQQGNSEIKRHIDFRDYLKTHPKTAEAYGQSKEDLARKFRYDSLSYVDGKEAFVRETDKKAKVWRKMMTDNQISAVDNYERKRISVLDSEIAYVDVGEGDPIVFLHGNPTSSYLWRNIIPHLENKGRCLAPDLIGMGKSGKNPSGSYRFVDHTKYLDAWFEALDLNNVTLVIHDWGSALGFYWAHRHPNQVKAICYMEAIVTPVTWDDWPENARGIFQAMRSPAGEEIVLSKNVFIKRIFPASVLRKMSEEEMVNYRAPFLEPGESRRPTLTWPREIPIEGQPADVHDIVEAYGQWLVTSDIPKFFINADPGSILTSSQRDFCRTWPNQKEVTVKGLHFIQEDSPADIGQAISTFLDELN